jgi:hypothetical protein
MTPPDALPPISPRARFFDREPEAAISMPSSQDFWRGVVQAAPNPRGLSGILNAIDALQMNENEDGYIFKPLPYASKNAKARIKYVYASLDVEVRDRLPAPNVVPDGTGGIVIQWNHAGRALNAGFPPPGGRRDYIYYQSGDEYRLIKATLPSFKERLEWLVHE